MLALSDLVLAKKTQRDKDWPMIRRLMEVHWFAFRDQPTDARVSFWLRELRTAALLAECVGAFRSTATALVDERKAVAAVLAGDVEPVDLALVEEQERERELDRVYWAPLRRELESLRRRS